MTPMTPRGRYSMLAAWLAISTPLDTLCRPSTFLACDAAQARWSIANPASSIASAWGLPVSWCTTSASCAIRRARIPRHLSSTSLRASKPIPAHHSAHSRAQPTASSTSAFVEIACTPTRSPVPGLRTSSFSWSVVCSVVELVETMSLLGLGRTGLTDEVGGLLADHDRGGVRVAAGYDGHDAGIGHP